MMSRKAKAVFYCLASPLMRISGILYRLFKAPTTGMVKVHLGPGRNGYMNQWINLDANIFFGKADVWVDLRNPLPFHNCSVDLFYSHHVIEHLPDIDGHFKEIYRCLKPGGIYRVGGPNGDAAITKFIEKDTQWFSDLLKKRESIGGRFESFIFCCGEHLTILTQSFLDEVMSKVGFTNLLCCKPMATHYPQYFQECLSKEYESDFINPHTLIIEGTKSK